METNDTHTQETTTNEATHESSPVTTKAPNGQLTTALIVIIVVLLFVMLMLSVNNNLFSPSNNQSSDITELKSRNATLRAEANAERARKGLPPLPEDTSSARTMAKRLQRDASALASLIGQWQTELEIKDTALRDYQSQLASRDENAKRLYAQIASLQSKIDQTANASEQLVSLSNDLKMANNQIENYRKQLAEFQGRPSNEQLAALRRQLDESIEIRSKLQTQIDTLLTQRKNKIDRSRHDELAAELEKLRPRLNKQRYEIQRLRAEIDRAHLFIESEKDLPAEATRLFAKLRTLENVNPQQLEAAYEGIRSTLGASIIHRQTFATGSSQITFDREKIIQNILDQRKNQNSFFLVVGYASKSGGTANNKKLSANRATTVASVVNTLKTSGQQVKAVYLGETTRFSRTTERENQICELWEIK